MVTSTPSVATAPAANTSATEAGVRVLARVMKQKREEAQALVRLVEQATQSDKGQNVNYYA
jgi:hypothetical protein